MGPHDSGVYVLAFRVLQNLGVWNAALRGRKIKMNHPIVIAVGITYIVGLILIVVFNYTDGSREESCVGCGQIYLPSTSNARDKFLFHDLGCQNAWEDRHPSETPGPDPKEP